MQTDQKKVTFPIPENWTPPEHEGQDFELVCTFRVEGDHLCLIQLGDHKMESYDGKQSEPKDDKPGYSSMANNLMSQDVPNAGAGY